MNKKTIYLVRHGESLKTFKGSDKLTPEEFELYRPINAEAKEKAAKFGKAISLGDFYCDRADLAHSGRLRSKQILIEIKRGSGINGQLREEFDLGYLLDERYVKASRTAVNEGKYSTSIDFFLNVTPEQFFEANNITDPSRTYSAIEMQENMKGVIKRGIDKSLFSDCNLGIYVGHEPVLSLTTLYLTDANSIKELDGKWEELEYAMFLAEKSIGRFPHIAMDFRGKQYDIGKKIYDKQ